MKHTALTLMVAAFVAASAITVLAHMKAEKMEPAADAILNAPPAKVQVWFTQAPDPKLSKIELMGPAGAVTLSGFQVTAADKSVMAKIDAKLGAGKYTAHWQSAGDDGHVQKGSYSFSVKTTH